MAWDVRGKTALVTGATNGIGLEASLELARRGARVLMVGRDRARTEAAVAQVGGRSGAKDAAGLLCDFSSQAQVRALAEAVRARVDRLHVLVNNAGTVNKSLRTTVDGIEATFAVNHLGPFLLTNLLTDVLVTSAPARVVTVASIGHRQGTLDFDDLGFERGYGIMRAYARSKLANVLFAAELARRLEGRGVASNSIHPGSVATNIWSGAPLWAKPFIYLVLRRSFVTAEEGARGVVMLAADPALEGATGRYYERGQDTPPAPLARDGALAKRLWDVSAALTGLARA
ncbi:MAG TPA: SDR family oxidoreductase [Vicinamibacteria bacterium]|nr:SDR family oxidoreductase [Vicinamibacteria bacterium]